MCQILFKCVISSVKQPTALNNTFPDKSPTLLSVETSWGFIWPTSHPSCELRLHPNTMDAHRAQTPTTAGIITEFPSLTAKMFPVCNFEGSFMSNLLLPCYCNLLLKSSVTVLDDNTKNIPSLYMVFEAMTLELFWMSQPYQMHPTAKSLAF